MQLREQWINDFTTHGATVKNDKGESVKPETRTSIAIGKVHDIGEAGRNNLKLTLKVPGAKYDFSGFLNDNSAVSSLLRQAKEKESAIAVRFEKKRKKGVAPDIPIAELTKDSNTGRENIINVVAGVYNFNEKQWILTDDAISNPKDDPENVVETLNRARQAGTDNFFDSEPTNSAPRINKEESDWKANHLLSMYTYACEHNEENEIGLKPEVLKMLAGYMLQACDQLQMKVYNVEAPNYNDYSHTKARGLLFSWMRANPLSKEIMQEKGGFQNWIKQFLTENYQLWTWAKNEAVK